MYVLTTCACFNTLLAMIANVTKPQNYFADIEQAAFSPSTMVPGFAASADPGKPQTPTLLLFPDLQF